MSSPQFSHVILPVGSGTRSGSCTRFELYKSHGATQRARYVHIALLRYSRSYELKPRGVRHSLVLGRGSARLEATNVGQSHGKNAYDSCLPKAVSVLGRFLATYVSWITDGSSPGPG